jgi:ribosomal protein S4
MHHLLTTYGSKMEHRLTINGSKINHPSAETLAGKEAPVKTRSKINLSAPHQAASFWDFADFHVFLSKKTETIYEY